MSGEEREPLLRGSDGEETSEAEGIPEVAVRLTKDPPATAGRAPGGTRFNLLFLKRFLLILLVAVPSICSISMLLLLLLILMRAAEEYNYYQMGILPSQFYTALAGKDMALFKDILWKMIIIVVSTCICKSGGEFMAGLVHVKWREMLSKFLHSSYFSHRIYYRLNIVDKRADNPDQRITQDVDRFCDEVSQALPKIILQPFLIAYYSYRTFISLGWFGVLGIYAFFIISTIINKFIMGPIVSYVFVQEKREGDFRFHHVKVRSNAEAVAFYQGGSYEARISNQRLKSLLAAQLGSVHWQLPLNFSVFMFDYVSTVISYSLVGVAIFSGMYDTYGPAQLASAISKNTFFSMYLLNGFSTVVDTAVKFAEIAGYTHRIGQLLEVLKAMNKEYREGGGGGARDSNEGGGGELCKEQELAVTSGSFGDSFEEEDEDKDESVVKFGAAKPSINQIEVCLQPPQCVDVAAVFTDVSVAPPGDPLPHVKGLNLEFRRGKNVLIMGETGTGKTSIFRVLSGLWSPLSGHVELCVGNSPNEVLFIPQRVHLTTGTLAEQVAFPQRPKRIDPRDADSCAVESKITECLAMAGLISLRDRLGGINTPVADNWDDVVTPGEAQRISFARIFYHQPPFVFLDEVTSALSEESEKMLYSKLTDLGITFMSIGQRSSLKKFHHQLLRLETDDSWTLNSIAT